MAGPIDIGLIMMLFRLETEVLSTNHISLPTIDSPFKEQGIELIMLKLMVEASYDLVQSLFTPRKIEKISIQLSKYKKKKK